MNIAAIDCWYSNALRDLGHNVLDLSTQGGIASLPAMLKANNFVPDFVVQQEKLAARTLFTSLQEIACPTVFISIDAHLNMFWHQYYGRLFDLVLTPHLTLYNELPVEDKLKAVQRFSPLGYDLAFKPFTERKYPLSFCGVVDVHRPIRKDMLAMLEAEFGCFYAGSSLNHTQMFELFANSQIIPNESICDEVNFRLFEASSTGALVFSPDIGEDQNVCFEPGREFEVYHDGLELREKIRFYLAHPESAQKIGLAGRARVQKEHLSSHRAVQLMQSFEQAKLHPARALGQDATLYLWLTFLQLTRVGLLPLCFEDLWGMQAALQADKLENKELLPAFRIILLAESLHPDAAFKAQNIESNRLLLQQACTDLLQSADLAGSLLCNLAASFAFMNLGMQAEALVFAQRQLVYGAGANGAKVSLPVNASQNDLFYFWNELLVNSSRYARLGFKFRSEGQMIPLCALECLGCINSSGSHEGQKLATAYYRVIQQVRGLKTFKTGFLAQLSLFDPQSWRKQLMYGLARLEAAQVNDGLAEIEQALLMAKEKGQLDSFRRVLAAAPASRYILPTAVN